MKKVLELNEQNFESEVLKSTGIVVVDFWAEWCGPCKIFGPIIEEVAEEVTAKVCKVNVDAVPSLANKYKIRSIPTVLIFKDGVNVSNFVGVKLKEEIKDILKEI